MNRFTLALVCSVGLFVSAAAQGHMMSEVRKCSYRGEFVMDSLARVGAKPTILDYLTTFMIYKRAPDGALLAHREQERTSSLTDTTEIVVSGTHDVKLGEGTVRANLSPRTPMRGLNYSEYIVVETMKQIVAEYQNPSTKKSLSFDVGQTRYMRTYNLGPKYNAEFAFNLVEAYDARMNYMGSYIRDAVSVTQCQE